MKYLCAIATLILVAVVPAKTTPSNKMLFIVDKSGSMDAIKVKNALQQFVNVAGQPTDDAELCVYQFARYPIKWAHGWKPLPSQKNLNLACRFLNKSPTANVYEGYTNLVPTLIAVLREPKKKMSIIIISDGNFSETISTIVATIHVWQNWRIRNGYGRAKIGCIGIGSLRSDALKSIANLNTSIGYYHLEEKKKKQRCIK